MADPNRSSPNRLVLCFDGTGNKFLGRDSDTNIVKIYKMLDRTCPNQYHYYQPGIGTYAQNQTSNSSSPKGLIRSVQSSVAFSIDQAVGTTFVHHVIAGYQFLMRYYTPGDQIYIFGFSRGAYTARFLAEMVFDIGLLSKGNEEMVHFAWTTFSDFQTSRSDEQRAYMKKFKETFCRPHIDIHFLGLFDCVNSVGQFETPFLRSSSRYLPIPPAKHVRHAVSINERRLKFKPALFDTGNEKSNIKTLKEVWFPGNHADIGGGWDPEKETKNEKPARLLSDIPLEWMMKELDDLGKVGDGLAIDDVKKREILNSEQFDRSKFNKAHDMLAFNAGTSRIGVLGWWILEILPFFARLELEGDKWVPRYWPPNLGAKRDIPRHADFHPSEAELRKILKPDQMPRVGGDEPPWLEVERMLQKWMLPSILLLGAVGAGAWLNLGSLVHG